MNRQASLIPKQQGNTEFHLTGIIVLAVHIRISATLGFIKKLPLLLPQKIHSTGQKARDICKAGDLARLRNGVETIPANIRKNYHLDKLPRGKQRGKFFFGSKIAALNFRKLFGFRKGLGNYAQNPVLA